MFGFLFVPVLNFQRCYFFVLLGVVEFRRGVCSVQVAQSLFLRIVGVPFDCSSEFVLRAYANACNRFPQLSIFQCRGEIFIDFPRVMVHRCGSFHFAVLVVPYSDRVVPPIRVVDS